MTLPGFWQESCAIVWRMATTPAADRLDTLTTGRTPRDTFGMRLMALRHDLSLRSGRPVSVEECAEAVEVSRAAWRQWELEIARPRHFRATVGHIARTFGYSESWLVGDVDEAVEGEDVEAG